MKGNYCLATALKEGGNIHSAHWQVLPASMAIPRLLVKTREVSLGSTWLSLCDIQSSADRLGDQVWPNSMSHPLPIVTA